jgi:hypothetical protein
MAIVSIGDLTPPNYRDLTGNLYPHTFTDRWGNSPEHYRGQSGHMHSHAFDGITMREMNEALIRLSREGLLSSFDLEQNSIGLVEVTIKIRMPYVG